MRKLPDKLVYITIATVFICIVAFVVRANYLLDNMVASCAPGLVLQTPNGWVCTEVIAR